MIHLHYDPLTLGLPFAYERAGDWRYVWFLCWRVEWRVKGKPESPPLIPVHVLSLAALLVELGRDKGSERTGLEELAAVGETLARRLGE